MTSSRFCKLVVSLLVISIAGFASAATASADKVLLFGPSVSGGASSVEGQQAAAQGFTVDVADASTWSAMTTAQFAAYRAIVISDNHDSGEVSDLAAAEANASVWAPAVTGNVIVTGADVEYHADLIGGGGDPGAVTYANRALAFAAGSSTQTGAYFSLDGYYGAPGGDPVKVLDGFSPGGFLAVPASDDDIHVDPAVTGPSGVSDSDLSGWGTTVHSSFSQFPTTFKVWAIGVDPMGPYTTSDGQQGNQDFLVRAALPPPAAATCVVPKLKGKSLKKAKKKLRNGNCKLGKKKGHGKKVKKQKPKAGTVLPDGSKVTVTVH